MEEFRSLRRLDYLAPEEEADPALDFAVLLPGDRGHMFGVLECLDNKGQTVWLRAFSSLGTGVREAAGWAPPILDEAVFRELLLPGQQEIKRLTRERNALPPGDPRRKELESRRREISRSLMPRVHDAYDLTNFRGETRPLREIFLPGKGIPGGVGDCCAPKLLHHAARHGLRPLSLAEFFWGGQGKPGEKQPGEFFSACAEKCQPILGFMLCGS